MEKRRHIGRELALILSAFVAFLVVFFWLRELNLQFPATYRILVGLVVAAAGITLGVLVGLFVTRNNGEQLWKYLPKFAPLWFFALGLLLFIIMSFVIIPERLISYWHTAGQSPLNLTAISRKLMQLLTDSIVFSYMSIFGLSVIRKLLVRKQATPEAN
ncbi:MAG: hypothetical protein ACYDCO_28090 [Armatimonadota bacterium]